jgi:hypothetical protein
MELKKCIGRKQYPILKISTTLQELEGFTYATALDLNMGYYTIWFDAKASEMCTIIFLWEKYSYNRLSMGFGGSADIFQAQMMGLMASLHYVQAYIDDLLVITRGSIEDHISKIENQAQTKKVQAVLMLNPPNNVKELRSFLGMIQYYQDMWVK